MQIHAIDNVTTNSYLSRLSILQTTVVTHVGSPEKLVMVRYGELFLKSESVKHHFIGMLLRNIGELSLASALTYHYETPRGRILICGDNPVRSLRWYPDFRTCGCQHLYPYRHPVRIHLCRGDRSCISKSSSGDEFCGQGKTAAENRTRTVRNLGQSSVLPSLIIFPDFMSIWITRIMNYSVEIRDFGGLVYDSRIAAPGGLPWAPRAGCLHYFHPVLIHRLLHG